MEKKPFLVHDNWDCDLAGCEYLHMRENCLFAVIWAERKEGGYNAYDFWPFVAMKKVINQGVEAYEGISLGVAWDEYKNDDQIQRVRKVGVQSRTYTPVLALSDTDRMTVVSSPDDILETFLTRWKQ